MKRKMFNLMRAHFIELSFRDKWFIYVVLLVILVLLLTGMGISSEFDPISDYYTEFYRTGMNMSIAVSLPLLLDSLLDIASHTLSYAQAPWLVFALLVPNFVQLVLGMLTESYPYAIGHSFLVIRELMLSATLVSFIFHNECSMSNKRTALFMGSTYLWAIILIWLRLCGYNEWVSVLAHLCLVSSVLSSLFFMIKLIKEYIKDKGNQNVDMLASSLFAVNILCKLIAILLRGYGFFPQIDVVICTLACVLPGRKARRETVMRELELASKRDFVSYISHEIRTPLNIVSLGLEMLSKDLKELQETVLPALTSQLDTLCDIEASCETATAILNELLLVNKIEGDSLSLDLEEVQVADFITTVAQPFALQARHKGVDFHFKGSSYLDPSLVEQNLCIKVDRSKFSQCLRNLFSNSIKFSSSGSSVSVYTYLVTDTPKQGQSNWGEGSLFSRHSRVFTEETVEVTHNKKHSTRDTPPTDTSSLAAGNMMLRIEVHDNGPGISQANQKRLFKHIVQFDPNELQGGGGSGVGLWISHAIVDMHDGVMGVKSVLGKGSMFFIQLPAKCCRSVPCSRDAAASKDKDLTLQMSFSSSEKINALVTNETNGKTAGVDVSDFRVCVVDDSSVNRKMLCKILSSQVASVCQCSNGQESVEVIRESMSLGGVPVDMVLMDVTMPVMGGVEATTLIRAMGYTGSVVFLTGNALPEERAAYLEAGGDRVLIKPCTLIDLQQALEFAACEKIKKKM